MSIERRLHEARGGVQLTRRWRSAMTPTKLSLGHPGGPGHPAVLVMVIAPVGIQRLRAPAGRPRRPRTGGMPRSSGMSCVTSWRVPPVRDRATGMPWPSAITWCLEPVFPRSTGLGPDWAALQRPHVGTAGHRYRPIQHARGMQPGQQKLVQLLPVLRPDASPAAAASRSCPSRSRAPAAGTPKRCRCRARTGCPARPSGHPDACGPDDRHGAARPAGSAAGTRGRGPAPAGRSASMAASAAGRGRSSGPGPPEAGRSPVRSSVLRGSGLTQQQAVAIVRNQRGAGTQTP